MGRKFNWALTACVTWGLVACGGGAPGGSTLVTPPDGSGGTNAGSGGNGGDGGDDQPIFGSSGDTGFPEPEGGTGGCDSACGGTDDPGGPGTLCGNHVLDAGEQCDDGNGLPGDGCSGACNLEPNFACDTVGEACVSTIACGDGVVAGLEACDDHNNTDDDGCSASCSVEVGFGCSRGESGSVCVPAQTVACGDSLVGSGEQCDDGNVNSNDGCSATCQVENGFVCPTVGQVCELVEYCGDGFLKDGAEQCDDGNRSPVDGCDGSCNILPNFICPTPGAACQSTVVCGDGQITGNETCDDGNNVGSDGCSALCRSEAGYTCTGGGATPVAGPCTPVPEERCGDSALAASEFCDDGNTATGDGCSPTCTIDPGYDCPNGPGELCVQVGRCGDGLVNVAGEQCDDGDNTGGDGCTATCFREALFSCPAQGGNCTSTVVCGDGVVNGSETCDDGTTADDGATDGCNASCQTKPGFVCVVGGVCRTVCGDGIRAGREQCDDGGTAPGNGCGADCRLEEGFKCTDPANPATAPDTCSATVCGDNQIQGTEQCDGGNVTPYDGCDSSCRKEPVCGGSPYDCAAKCGDGMKFPEEACDDGNILDGDGCDHNCALEEGFDCTNNAADLGAAIDLPVILRDFHASHPHFEVNPGTGALRPGMVLTDLSPTTGKPVYNVNFSANGRNDFCMDVTTANCSDADALTDAQITTNFNQWYVTDGVNNSQVLDVLTLDQIATGTYQFAASGGANQFFPLDGRGFNENSTGSGSHNFHFTSEVHQWFTYDGAAAQRPLLTFSGDDDVWVFVNGKLAVDLGGVHGELTGSIELIGSTGQSSRLRIPANSGTFSTVNLPMDAGGVNEIAVFQAERHVTQSNYTLTLQGFNAPITSCASDCGDEIVTADEDCDLGDVAGGGGNTGAYGTCNADCTLPARCGDGITNGPEECDNGLNTDTRFQSAGDCAPGCVLPPSCGDGNVDGAFLETCDNGNQNASPGTYGACGTNCQLGPRCGDGVTNGPEQCDTGAANGTGGSPCLSNCTLRCGNGVVDQGEQCDLGASNNGAYNGCEATCKFAPRCGDATIDVGAGEACDDGLNDGSYGHCASNCQPGPFCGDNTLQAQFGESCDNGNANVSSGYGPNLCTTQCRPAPRCGDHAVNAQAGETCDDGVNDGSPGSCAADCKSAIPLSSCGNGAVNAGELCDNGAANGTVGNTCDVRCELACGNGFVDATEQCDDGVNSGAYGTCTAICTFAGFCGDGATSGPEACDDGASNVAPASAYGGGVCTTSCARAPRCGDGRVDTMFGEQCDGGPGCTASCNQIR